MLQIRLLGQFDVRADGKRVTIPSRTAQSLFAYLALTAGTTQRREKLAGIFWPDSSDENARKNLRQELWRIRKAISAQDTNADDYFVADEFTLTFNPDANYWLDVNQIEKDDADIQSLTSNLSLYQGELLPGFFDDWVVLERERVQNTFETGMEQLVSQLVAAERWIAVQEQGERWLTLSAAPEPAYRALMLAHGARGNTAKVASTYQRCVDELQEQFGVEPSAETRALYEGLLKGAKAPLPPSVQLSSTVTFLFTDIEGSTRLLDKLGGQYATMLAEHHEILRASIQKWNGHEVDTQGDAFFVTFTRASDAVQCATDAQRALASHSWTSDLPLRVRMGLHTGEPLIASTGYVGMDVHRAARIGDVAHGGQVLLSQTTRELVKHDLPAEITIRELGEYRLKDMKYPTPIYQLVIEGLPFDFPALRMKFTGTESPTPGEPPFKGLQYFDESDSDLFFGREALTAKLVARLRDAQFLSVIVGASGSGKSSVARAGLIPALRTGKILIDGTKPPEGSSDWNIHVITPSAHPLEALATELTRDSESLTATTTLIDDLTSDPRSLHLYLLRNNSASHTLLLIDQFEELFTLCRDEFEREAFIDNLLTAISSPLALSGVSKETKRGEGPGVSGNATLIITLRADFYAHLAQYPDLRDAVAQHQEYIGPMTTEELRRAIEEPASQGHWEFESGLVDLILRDVGDEPGALPLLSHALLETWKRRAGHMLTLKGYADAGGVHGAIAHTAESVYQNLSSDEQIIARNLFLRLTELGEGTEDTRRRASFDELMSQAEDAGHVRTVLNKLAEARLITVGEESAEVAHEALIREWPTLREWLNQDREGLRLHRHITEASREWELLGRDPGALYRGAHLAQAREWAISHPKDLNAGERAFLDASNELEQREQMEREEQQRRELESARKLAETEKARSDEQQRNNQRLRWRAVWLTAALLVAAALAVVAFVFGQQAISRERIATARELAQAALNSLNIDPERSLLLGLESSTQWAAAGQPIPYDLQETLHQALQASRVRLSWSSVGEDILFIGFDPQTDAPRVVTGNIEEAQVKIWDAAANRVLLTLPGRVDHFTDVAISPDGRYIVVPGSENVVRVWESATGQVWRSLSGHTGELHGAVFSPDGRFLATYGLNEQIVWDVETGERLLETPAPVTENDVMAFSPDGKYFATVSGSQVVIVLEIVTGREVLNRQHDFDVVSFAFSPDGSRVAAGGRNSTLKVWDALTGDEILSLPVVSAGQVEAIAFSPNGTRLIAGPQVWDAATGKELFQLLGHTKGISRLAFNASGTMLITSSYDGTARLWDLTPSHEVFNLNHAMPAFGIAFSPDGKLIATSSGDQTAMLWDAASGQAVRRLAGHSDFVNSVAFSPDGKLIATAGADRVVILWEVATGERLRTLTGHTEDKPGTLPILRGVMAVVFSPQCAQTSGAGALRCPLASVGMDGQLIVWDAFSGEKLLTYQDEIGGLKSVAYSPDGKMLTVGNTGDFNNPVGDAKLLDATTGEVLRSLPAYPGWVWGLAFSPDGERLASVHFWGTGKVWDVSTGEELTSLDGLASGFSLAFSQDGKIVATGGGEGIVHLWDAYSGVPLFPLTGPTDPVFGLAFSPDGKYLALSSSDGVARVYVVPPEDLLALARARLTRSFTVEECQKYLHQATCP